MPEFNWEERSYWASKGTHQALADKLQEKIPPSGEVDNHEQNPLLEKFRKAVNVYYDIYNNGLINRAREFREVFGFSSGMDERGAFERWNTEEEDDDYMIGGRYEILEDNAKLGRVEDLMDQIVLAAAKEQGLTS